MKQSVIILFLWFFAFKLDAQHIHLSTWTGYNRTAYKLSDFESTQSYFTYGGRLAFGLEHVQIGGEYEAHISNPSFVFQDSMANDIRKEEFASTYYGGLIRWNTAKTPVYRFGFVFKAGAGVYDTKKEIFALPEDRLSQTLTYPDKIFGFNAGLGMSSPLYRLIHWELHYQFNFVKRPELNAATEIIPEHKAIHHSVQLGISLNLVFGEAAKRSQEVLKAKKRK